MVSPVGGRIFPSYINPIEVGSALLRIPAAQQPPQELTGHLSLSRPDRVASSYTENSSLIKAKNFLEASKDSRFGHALFARNAQPECKEWHLECDGVPTLVEVRDSNPVYIPAEQRTKEVIQEIRPSVVSLFMTGTEENPETGESELMQWSGTGFVVDHRDLGLRGYEPPEGKILIATNHHVANGANFMEMEQFDGEGYLGEVSVLLSDEELDIAILEVDAADLGLKPIPIGGAEDIDQGEFVLAFGHPYGLPFRVTSGIINNTFFDEEGMIQTDAAINPGNSGGPLVDLSTGRVVGMNTFIYRGANTMGFAMPIWQQFGVLREIWEDQYWNWNAELIS